jgi:hypothetical protein
MSETLNMYQAELTSNAKKTKTKWDLDCVKNRIIKKSFLVNALWRKCKFEGKEKWQLSFSVQWHLLTSLFTCFYIPCAKTCRFYWLPWTDLMKNVTNLFFLEENLIMELLRLHEIQSLYLDIKMLRFFWSRKKSYEQKKTLCYVFGLYSILVW